MTRAFAGDILIAKRVRAGFGVALTLLIAVGAGGAALLDSERSAGNKLAQSQEILASLQTTLSHLQDAETGQRGYLLMADEAYLNPYRAAAQLVHQDIAAVRKLTKDSATQTRNLVALDSLVTMKLVELDQALTIRKSEGLNAAIELMQSHQGRKVMDEIRVQVQWMRDAEEKLVLELKAKQKTVQSYLNGLLVTEALIGACVVFLALWVVNLELTALRQAEQLIAEKKMKLLAASKYSLLGELTSGVALELTAPLSALLELLDRTKEGEQKDSMELIRSYAHRIAAVVKGLREFVREDQRPVERIAAAALVDETLLLCRESLKCRGVVLRASGATGSAMVECRKIDVLQALLNLIHNAADAVADEPEKWVGVHINDLDRFVEICVTDSGHGISKSLKEKLFQPFFSTKPIGKGTGLGLSVTQSLIEAHGGSIRIDESCPNTRFVVSLPKYQTQIKAA